MGAMKHVEDYLSGAETPQEFMVLLGNIECDPRQLVCGEEIELLLAVRDALGLVLNKNTATWIPSVNTDVLSDEEEYMSEHTNKPLEVQGSYILADDLVMADCSPARNSDEATLIEMANAERLALCWNFCLEGGNLLMRGTTLGGVCEQRVRMRVALLAARNALFGKSEQERYEVLQLIDMALGGKS